jgi:hypothetical protein
VEKLPIPEAVKELAEKGVAYYQREKIKDLRNDLRANNACRGGREKDWLKQMYGYNFTFNGYGLPKLRTFTIDEINLAVEEKKRALEKEKKDAGINPSERNFSYIVWVHGLSANYWGDAPIADWSVMQTASQSNYLESKDPNRRSPVSDWFYDDTQGPQLSIESPAASLHRSYVMNTDSLDNVLEPKDFNMAVSRTLLGLSGGYVTLRAKDNLDGILNSLKHNYGKMAILAQPVIHEASNHRMLQVFNFAPQLLHRPRKKYADALDRKICESTDAIVVNQYITTSKISLLMSMVRSVYQPAFFTLIGQGVFLNPKSTMIKSIRAVDEEVKGTNVVPVFHTYSGDDYLIVEKALEGKKYLKLSPAQFLAIKDISEIVNNEVFTK